MVLQLSQLFALKMIVSVDSLVGRNSVLTVGRMYIEQKFYNKIIETI